MDDKKDDEPKTKVNNYARYSSVVFQMGALIGLGVWGGRQIDQSLGLKFPAFTLVLLFVAIFVGMYWALRDLLKKKE